jgi:hypothetical protein
MGVDHVIWGTDSVLHTAAVAIEALRRPEIPEDMRKVHGFVPWARPTVR